MIINDREWRFLSEQTGLSAPFNDMYFKYLRDLGYNGTLQDMITAAGTKMSPSQGGVLPVVPVGYSFAVDYSGNYCVDHSGAYYIIKE